MKQYKRIMINKLIFFFICIVNINLVNATLLEKMNTEKLTLRAHAIIVGEVINTRCIWDHEWKMIFTLTTIMIEDSIKGNLQKNEIEILYLGGNVGSKSMIVEGTPRFMKGERVLLFIEPEIKNTFRVVGWFQGKFGIVNDTVIRENKSLNEFITEIQNIMSAHNIPSPKNSN